MAGLDWGALLAAGAGIYAANKAGSKPAGTTTETREPWKPAQQDLVNILGQARNLYGQTSGMPPWMQQQYNQLFGVTNALQSRPMPQYTPQYQQRSFLPNYFQNANLGMGVQPFRKG